MNSEAGISFWKQPGKVEELIRLWALDTPAVIIAQTIGATGRNAVIGKAGRLGLPMRGPRRTGTGATRGIEVSPHIKRPKKVWVADPLSADRRTPFSPLPGSEPVPFLQNPRNGCRWPIDMLDGALFCCGRDRDKDHPSYCRAHRVLGVQSVVTPPAVKPMRRAA